MKKSRRRSRSAEVHEEDEVHQGERGEAYKSGNT